MNRIENKTGNIKLYSLKTICITTFLCGLLATGYMVGENFKALNKPKEGKISFIIGIIVTIIFFIGLFLIPGNIIDRIPTYLIPLIYTGIIWRVVEKKQGEALKLHEKNGNSFFSGWRAAGIGLISVIIILIGILGYIFLGINNDVYNRYDSEIEIFKKNDDKSLVFYDHLDTKTNNYLIKELEEIIPKCKENIEIIEKTNKFKDLPDELIEQNKILLKYSKLRLEAFELFKKSIEENTDKYQIQLERIHKEIDEQLTKLENEAGR